METIAKRLEALRKNKNMKLSEVAAAIGVADSTYREWELGREIRGEPYLKLARVFDVSVAYLLGGEDAARETLRAKLNEIEILIKDIRLHL